MPDAADAPRRRLGNSFHHIAGDEAARVDLQGDAQPQKLLDAHLTLPVEDVPEALVVDARSTGKLGDTHTLQRSSFFYACYW